MEKKKSVLFPAIGGNVNFKKSLSFKNRLMKQLRKSGVQIKHPGFLMQEGEFGYYCFTVNVNGKTTEKHLVVKINKDGGVKLKISNFVMSDGHWEETTDMQKFILMDEFNKVFPNIASELQ